MAKLTNEYIQERIAGDEKVSEAYIDANGDVVIIAADGFGWDCGDMPPATIDHIPAGKGVKHFLLALDQLVAIDATEADATEADESDDPTYQADCEGDAKHEARIYEDAADDE